jgi:hypothetical protein
VAHPIPVPERGPVLGQLPVQGVPLHLHADQLSRHPPATDPLECRLPDVVGFLLLHQPLQAGDLEGVVGQAHVGAVVEDPGLDPARLARRDRTDVVRATGLHDPLPQVVPAIRIPEVDLVPDLSGPSRSPDDHGDAVQRGIHAPVVAEVENLPAEQVSHHILGLRSLDLYRKHRWIFDPDVHPAPPGHAASPQPGVAVGQGQPETVFLEPEEDGVVDDPPVPGDEGGVLALADLTAGQIPAGQEVGESRRVRAGDLHDVLGPDVPQRDVVQEMPVLLDRVVVVGRQVGVVVDVEGRAAVTDGGLEERRPPVPGSEVQRGLGLAGHPQLPGLNTMSPTITTRRRVSSAETRSNALLRRSASWT